MAIADARSGSARRRFRERELHKILRYHAANTGSEVGRVEANGATNFLALDDLVAQDQGNALDPESSVPLSFDAEQPVFPALDHVRDDPFLRKLAASQKKWIALSDEQGQPRLLMNANAFLRDYLALGKDVDPGDYCHRPAVVHKPTDTLDKALGILATHREQDPSHDETVILLWSPEMKRMITGSDVLRCLLSWMGKRADALPEAEPSA